MAHRYMLCQNLLIYKHYNLYCDSKQLRKCKVVLEAILKITALKLQQNKQRKKLLLSFILVLLAVRYSAGGAFLKVGGGGGDPKCSMIGGERHAPMP